MGRRIATLLRPRWRHRRAALLQGALDAFGDVPAAALFGMLDMPLDTLFEIGVPGHAVGFVPVPVDHVMPPASCWPRQAAAKWRRWCRATGWNRWPDFLRSVRLWRGRWECPGPAPRPRG